MKQIDGQMSLFNIKQKNDKNVGLGEPCESCDVEWCSATCFVAEGICGACGDGLRGDQTER